MTGQPNLVSHSARLAYIYIGHLLALFPTMSLSASESSLAAASSCSGPYEPRLVQPAIPLVFVTPVFPFYARYIWLTIDAKETLASLNDPDVDIITQDIKGKTYIGCAVQLPNTWSPDFTSAAMELLAPGKPEQFAGIEPWMSFPLFPQVEDPRPDREALFSMNAFPLPGFCHWTILPTVTCRFPKDRREPGDTPRLTPVSQCLYLSAKLDAKNSRVSAESSMPPAGALAAQPLCRGGYDISSFSAEDIADPRDFFAEQRVLFELEQESLARRRLVDKTEPSHAQHSYARPCPRKWREKWGKFLSQIRRCTSLVCGSNLGRTYKPPSPDN
ncbi:hypothetical protein EDD18DRAFT_1176997 [Armillaria luteobubalina]|uniref:Uncharacterized protein n=1 Tax=Armillaria luteobubalina TaxID=153913 RepID=A0AA39Q0D8_9AGAR|nr:hypothetical protein EDD18DRAFT_1176997 [Armillaria luteobubalina]